jgi:hypothetical protein
LPFELAFERDFDDPLLFTEECPEDVFSALGSGLAGTLGY